MNESIEEQRKKAETYLNKSLQLGDKWYLINADWFNKWLIYIGMSKERPNFYSNQAPGRIDNSNLLMPDKVHLRESLTEEIDYFPISEELWNYLSTLYQITQPEDKIERVVINDSVDSDFETLHIEIRPISVSLKCKNWSKSQNQIHTHEMSRQTTLETIINEMRKLFSIPVERKVRLFYESKDEKNSTLIDIKSTNTLTNTGYGTDDIIVCDVECESGSWSKDIDSDLPSYTQATQVISSQEVSSTTGSSPIPTAPILSSSISSSQTNSSLRVTRSYDSYSNRYDHKPGLCGLSNLGNTCFMNSGIQCMSNVPVLTDFFRSGTYKNEINKTNPLGCKGQIAEAYADLINEMWSGHNSYTIPRNFKLNLSKFAPQFTGFQQQDSQELLAFLLDGLHEDLNRIIKKPYVELGSHVGKTDEKFAEESWQDHKKRNDSIIVDLFHGLLKSTLNCLDCNEISIKFDPFCYLSLPLPSKKERQIEVVFVPLDPNQKLVKLKLSVLKSGTIQDVCAALETCLPNVSKSNLLVCDVYSQKFYKIFESHEPIQAIGQKDDIRIYELASAVNNTEFYKVKLHLRERGTSSYNSNFFGLPLLFQVPKTNLTNSNIYNYTFQALKRFLKDPNNPNEDVSLKLIQSPSEEENIDTEMGESNSEMMNEESSDDTPSSTQSSTTTTRSSQRLKMKSLQQSRLFNLIVSKSDQIDYDHNQYSIIYEDTTFELPRESSFYQGSNQFISLIADFSPTLNKRFYNKKVFDDYIEHPSCNVQLAKKKDVINLSDCFNLYTKTEDLSEQDYWFCSKCKTHQPSTKKFDLWSLPPVLVVHLKRFSYSRISRDKIDSLVDFPLTDLDMQPYVINKKLAEQQSTKYDLIAVSNHYGGLGGGHYTAYGKNRNDGKWYYFDDSSVSSSDESSVCTNAAYLLIYLRKDMYQKYLDQAENIDCNNFSKKMDF